jgi:hypothetical protein
MESFARDIRYALRVFSRSPGFTAAAVLAMALGVGGSSAIFSVLDSVVLRPLSAPEPDRLLRVYERRARVKWTRSHRSTISISRVRMAPSPP